MKKIKISGDFYRNKQTKHFQVRNTARSLVSTENNNSITLTLLCFYCTPDTPIKNLLLKLFASGV